MGQNINYINDIICSFEQVEEFEYLGVNINENNRMCAVKLLHHKKYVLIKGSPMLNEIYIFVSYSNV